VGSEYLLEEFHRVRCLEDQQLDQVKLVDQHLLVDLVDLKDQEVQVA
jgi:hypothetical protein